MKVTATAVLVAMCLATTALKGQVAFISPTNSEVITTPDPLIVSITQNGTNVPMTTISLWRYDRLPLRTNEAPSVVTSITASNSLEYSINLTNYPFSDFGCGDYLVKVQYPDPTSPSGYSIAVSGEFRILMDRPRIRIDSPTAWSTWVRGQTNRIIWEVLSKPGQVVSTTVGLTTPNGDSYDDDPAFDLTDEVGTTNQFLDWIIPTNTVTEDGHQFPDGYYTLAVLDDNSPLYTQVQFNIDTAATIPATLVWTNLSYPTRTGWQVSGQWNRAWWIQESTNLINWQQSTNALPDKNGDLIPFSQDGSPQKFYRLILAQ
jgi:hypothetical protein